MNCQNLKNENKIKGLSAAVVIGLIFCEYWPSRHTMLKQRRFNVKTLNQHWTLVYPLGRLRLKWVFWLMLRDWIHLVFFLPFLQGRQLLWLPVNETLMIWKEVCSKRNEYAFLWISFEKRQPFLAIASPSIPHPYPLKVYPFPLGLLIPILAGVWCAVFTLSILTPKLCGVPAIMKAPLPIADNILTRGSENCYNILTRPIIYWPTPLSVLKKHIKRIHLLKKH